MLRVALISHSEAYYSTRRLLEAGATLGYAMSRVDPIRVVVAACARGQLPLLIDGDRALAVPDVALPRIGTTLSDWGLALLETWCIAGARSAQTPAAIRRAGDKLAATLRFAERGIPFVPTVACREAGHAAATLQMLTASTFEGARDTWVMKPVSGTGGERVCIAQGTASAQSVLAALTATHAIVLVQPFVPVTPARDLRVLIAGGEVLATCVREATHGDFRANIHQGGIARAVPPEALPSGTEELALRAAEAVGLPFAGVDLIETPDGLAVLEVNASPGFRGIEEATGRDLATPFLQRFIAWSTP